MLRLRFAVSLVAFLVLLALQASASDVYISNSPFKGKTLGVGSEMRLGLLDVGEALNLAVKETDGQWSIGGFDVETTSEEGVVLISIQDLPTEVVRVVISEELQTVDIYKVQMLDEQPAATWAGEGTLVLFYADWSPPCQAMESTIIYFIKSQTLDVELLNIDKPQDRVYRSRVRLFEGDVIPYFVVLDKRGRKLHSFAGFRTYNEMTEELKKAFSKQN
jgi:thiol-disulfide isomerase/thioredoxin